MKNIINLSESEIRSIVESVVREKLSEGVIQKKPNGKWGIKGKQGQWWNAEYDSKKSAEDGLKAYFANK